MNGVLGLYFDPDFDPQTKAAVREEFVRALSSHPMWAVHRAFDAWARQHTRRPSPGEIVILVQKELQPITNELARRRRAEEERAAEDQAARERRCSPEEAERILAGRGFTPKRFGAVSKRPMAGSVEELEIDASEAPRPHWTATVAADSPEMQALRAARLANPLMRAGMQVEPEEGAA